MCLSRKLVQYGALDTDRTQLLHTFENFENYVDCHIFIVLLLSYLVAIDDILR